VTSEMALKRQLLTMPVIAIGTRHRFPSRFILPLRRPTGADCPGDSDPLRHKLADRQLDTTVFQNPHSNFTGRFL
jgi:hypothetical protein